MNTLAIALLSIVLSVVAQFSLKAGMSSAEVREALAQPFVFRTALTVLTNQFVFAGFFLYGLGAVVWLGVLSKCDVSKAYPLVGLGFVATVMIGYVLGEQVSWVRGIGVVMVCAGVVIIGRT